MYYGMFYDPTFIILIPAVIITVIAQSRVNRAYGNYSQVADLKGITGAEAARRILDANGLADVPVEMTGGYLSDHYDPRSRTMRLSGNVYNDPSLASIAIAAHEAGHAIQHSEKYALLSIRNAIAVPVSVISHMSWPLLIIGIVAIQMGYLVQGNWLFNIGIIAFVAVVVFHLVTLPVELNASKRAIDQLRSCGIIFEEEAVPARKVLSAAALTYVAALATAVLNLLRLLLIRGRN